MLSPLEPQWCTRIFRKVIMLFMREGRGEKGRGWDRRGEEPGVGSGQLLPVALENWLPLCLPEAW